MTNPSTAPDPHAADHSDPALGGQLEAAADRTTEIAKDNVWLVCGGVFLLGILIGAAATHASTPEPTVRHVAQRSLRSAQRGTRQATRRLAAHLPAKIRPPITLCDRIAHALRQLGS
jgi:hypothetical protein